MEPRPEAAQDGDPQEIVTRIDQKALRLSALLRDIDNHPVQLDERLKERLDGILELLACRVAATRALLHDTPPLAMGAVSTG